jgi:ribosomal protein S18 acetylase RimI-like enzyme
MSTKRINVRLLERGDFNAVVEIDEKVFGQVRPEYYEMKFARALEKKDRLVVSFVAVEDERVVGFVMCELSVGEYGIPDTEAFLDTIGINPAHQNKGIGRLLLGELVAHLKKAGVEKIDTLVNWNDWQLVKFLNVNGFKPSSKISLELNLD